MVKIGCDDFVGEVAMFAGTAGQVADLESVVGMQCADHSAALMAGRADHGDPFLATILQNPFFVQPHLDLRDVPLGGVQRCRAGVDRVVAEDEVVRVA